MEQKWTLTTDWGTHKQWLAPEPGDHAITELSTEGVQLTPWHLFFMLLDSYLWLVLWIKYTKVWCLICLPHVFWFIQNSFLCKLQFKRIGISFFLIFICKQNIQKMSVNAFGIKHNVYQDFWLNTSLFTFIRIFNPKWQKWQHHDKTC